MRVPRPGPRSRYSIPSLAVVGVIIWILIAQSTLPLASDAARLSVRNIHRSNKLWASNFVGSKTTVPLLPDGDGKAAEDARAVFQALLEVRGPSMHAIKKLLLKRLDAFQTVLQSDNEIRRAWNARFAGEAPRGIAVTAGGKTPLANAFATIYTLRNTLKCKLPIKVVHWGQAEIDPVAAAAFKRHLPDVTFFDLGAPGVYPSHHLSLADSLKGTADPKSYGYVAKVAALYVAPFREVLLLDADSLPLLDPATLFDLAPYKEHGGIFWPDFWEERPEIWDVLGMVGADPWSAAGPDPFRQNESGQIVIDRVRHWKVLEWALFLNTHAQLVYTLRGSLGEKDLYAPSFALAGEGKQFWQVPFVPSLPAVDLSQITGAPQVPRFAFAGMVQLHPETGSPCFYHRTAYSKLPGRGPIGPHHSAPTHVSPPASQSQAGKMTAWRGNIPGWIFKMWRKEWGLWESEVESVICNQRSSTSTASSTNVYRCSADLSDLAIIDEICSIHGKNRTMKDKRTRPLPITMVNVDAVSALGKVTAAAIKAHELFQTFQNKE